ncbi:hypothetical protein SAMN05421505_14036 [Sinosporangium album]|uniref:Uncharacterized protein n=1 Tax=Sinosporangium album TaxID=504805 RepID=A0A1G8J0F0_9ACTN|nr:hypothetical protein [Sinosporangium album]SDI24765.1 hypothetical protein SAMN05421505_14036 [Sinosporangium album]
MLFAPAMAGSSTLSFQVYLALPLELDSSEAVSVLFVVFVIVAVVGQMRVTHWARRRWSGPQAIAWGLDARGRGGGRSCRRAARAAGQRREVTRGEWRNLPVIPFFLLI